MASFNLWQKWLCMLGVVFVIFGLYMALLSWSPLFAPFGWLVNGTFWQGQAPGAATQQFGLWVYGMLGGAMIWMGTMIYYLAKYPFARKEKWSSDCLLLGMAGWFVVDTLMSAYTGAYFNVAFNVAALCLVAVPLVVTRKEFT